MAEPEKRPGKLTAHASRLCVVLTGAVCLAGACSQEEDAKNQVPERVRNAAMAYCEWLRDCGSAHYIYESAEQCVYYETTRAWEDSGECIEAWINAYGCVTAGPCRDVSDECGIYFEVRQYHCWRRDTDFWGRVCCAESADWEACVDSCPCEMYEMVLCSDQTPDYCTCGQTRCLEGEYCCTCLEWY